MDGCALVARASAADESFPPEIDGVANQPVVESPNARVLGVGCERARKGKVHLARRPLVTGQDELAAEAAPVAPCGCVAEGITGIERRSRLAIFPEAIRVGDALH